ncbi:hypothetical protein HHI36_011142 [Cryptolaemus montrouzieri]|uniref:Uncharacterized protein n=1 Tax=Cryptolaemus montrouzieri TaxID=559131 RepID=A0ABD2MKS9_9CUCU
MECYISRQKGHIAIKSPNTTQDNTQITTNRTQNGEATIQNTTLISDNMKEQCITSHVTKGKVNDSPNRKPLSESITTQESTINTLPDNLEGLSDEANKTSMPPPIVQKEPKLNIENSTSSEKKEKKPQNRNRAQWKT